MQKETARTKSSEFREESDTSQAEHDRNFQEENLEVALEEIHDHSGNLIGGSSTHLAMKSEDSYAIGTSRKGLKVIEGSREIYLDRLLDDQEWLKDLAYIHHLDCYLMDCRGKSTGRISTRSHLISSWI